MNCDQPRRTPRYRARRYLDLVDTNLLAPLETGTDGLADLDAFVGRLGSQLDDPRFVAGCLLTNSLAEFGGRDAAVVGQGLGVADLASR